MFASIALEKSRQKTWIFLFFVMFKKYYKKNRNKLSITIEFKKNILVIIYYK